MEGSNRFQPAKPRSLRGSSLIFTEGDKGGWRMCWRVLPDILSVVTQLLSAVSTLVWFQVVSGTLRLGAARRLFTFLSLVWRAWSLVKAGGLEHQTKAGPKFLPRCPWPLLGGPVLPLTLSSQYRKNQVLKKYKFKGTPIYTFPDFRSYDNLVPDFT